MRTTPPMRQWRVLCLLAVLAIVAAACGSGTTSPQAEEGGSEAAAGASEGEAAGDASTLVVGNTEVPSHLDPAVVYEKLASDVLYNTTNRLVEFSVNGEIEAGVAEEWEVSDDGTVYTFTLREGVTFHDGSDMTSEDVKWSLERATNINHPESAAFLLGGIESIETPDDLTVEITLAEPSATFLPRLNYTVATILPSDGDVYTAPDEALEEPSAEEAEEFINDEAVVGTGPYELTNYTPGESLTLEAYDGYWGEAPAIDTVQIQFFETSAQMRNAMAAGEIDLNINEFAPAERASLAQEEGIELSEGDVGLIRYIVLDVTAEPFTDPEVRRAMSAAIDRQRIIDEVFEGAGVPLYSMVPSAFEESADYMSDIEAEVPEGTEIELWYPLNKYGDTEPDVAETISRSLEEAGFTVTLQSADWAAEYSDNTTTGAYSAYLLGWYPDYVDPDAYVDPFYGGGYIPYYQDEQMQELIAQSQGQEIGSEERAQTFDEIQQKAAEDMPYIPLYEGRQIAYFQDTVSGVEDTLTAAQQTWFYVMSKEG